MPFCKLGIMKQGMYNCLRGIPGRSYHHQLYCTASHLLCSTIRVCGFTKQQVYKCSAMYMYNKLRDTYSN